MNGIRCGRCIAQDHAACVGSIKMGPAKASYLWRCDCGCAADIGASALRIDGVQRLR